MDRTDKTLIAVEKIKKEVRQVQKEKMSVKRASTCADNDEFRRRAIGPVMFVDENQAKLKSLLQGERDTCPSDLGQY